MYAKLNHDYLRDRARTLTPNRPECINRIIAEKQLERAQAREQRITTTNTPIHTFSSNTALPRASSPSPSTVSPNTIENNVNEQITNIITNNDSTAQTSVTIVTPTPPIKPWHRYLKERQALRQQHQANNIITASTSITTSSINNNITNITTTKISTHNIKTQTDINESIDDAIIEAENDTIKIEAKLLRSLTVRDFTNNICPVCNELVINTLGRGLLGVDKKPTHLESCKEKYLIKLNLKLKKRCDRCSVYFSKLNLNNHKLTCRESFVGKMSSLSCPVCKESYHDIPGDEVFILKKCSHLICFSCLRTITAMNKYNCPVCRTPFQDVDIGRPN